MKRLILLAVVGAVIGFSLGPVVFDECSPNVLWYFMISGVVGAVVLPLADAILRAVRRVRDGG